MSYNVGRAWRTVWTTALAFGIACQWHVLATYRASPQRKQARIPEGFRSLFDGKSLNGWTAVPRATATDWSVRDGAIHGHGSANRLAYLVWKDKNLRNFELRLKYRMLTRGNTGIEIRAIPDPTKRRPFLGYHADLGHVGIGPHILGAWDFHFAGRREYPCPRGKRLVIDKQGKASYSDIPNAVRPQDIARRGWNRVRIIAKGDTFQFFINGKPASAFVDDIETGRLERGAIGLQLHDKGMQVQFKDIWLRRLGDAD